MGKGARQQSARERMRAERQRQASRQRTTRRALIAAAAVAVVAVAVGIGVFVQSQRAASNDGVQPVSLAVGSGKPVVHVYEDFQCPACRQFEQISGDMLTGLARQGKAKVVYHPVSIFQDVLAERSLRASSAAMCAADQGKFAAYHKLLFEKQPPESKPAAATDTTPPEGNVPVAKLRGFENWKLIRYGETVGLSGQQFAQCVKSDKYESRIQAYTDEVLSSGKVGGTPTVYVGNSKISNQVWANPAALKQRILSAGQR